MPATRQVGEHPVQPCPGSPKGELFWAAKGPLRREADLSGLFPSFRMICFQACHTCCTGYGVSGKRAGKSLGLLRTQGITASSERALWYFFLTRFLSLL